MAGNAGLHPVPKPPAVPIPELSLENLIDDLGETQRLYDLWKPQVNPHAQRLTELNAQLEGRYSKLAAGQSAIARGAAYQLEVTPKEWKRTITRGCKEEALKLLKKLNRSLPLKAQKSMWDLFDTTLAKMTQHLGKAFVESHVDIERTGPREYRVTALEKAGSTTI